MTFTLGELREQWKALAEADTLHMLPQEALISSIKGLAEELLDFTKEKAANEKDLMQEARDQQLRFECLIEAVRGMGGASDQQIIDRATQFEKFVKEGVK